MLCYSKSYNGSGQVFTNNIQGTNPQDVSNYSGTDDYPRWSPDGRYIVYRRHVGILGPVTMVYDSKNQAYTNVTSDGGGTESLPDWTPNGKVYVAYHAPVLSRMGTYLMNPDGSEKKKILDTAAVLIYFYQDGNTFLYSKNRTDIYKSSIVGSFDYLVCDLKQTVSNDLAVQGFNLLTEKLLLTYTDPKDGRQKIGAYSVMSGTLDTLLTAEIGFEIWQTTYSNNGTKVAFVEVSSQDEFLSILENGVKRRIVHIVRTIPATDFSFNPMSFSPDDQYIAFSEIVYQPGPWLSMNEHLYVVDVGNGKTSHVDEGGYPSWKR